jgi:hypothetical protein
MTKRAHVEEDDRWFDEHACDIVLAVSAAESNINNKKKSRVQLVKVISGGQNGADRAALEAARECGLATGGFAPRGFLTSTGPDFTLQSVFGLEELPIFDKSVAQMFVLRSQRNVDVSNATIAFRLCESVGTDKTIGYCVARRWKAAPRAEWGLARYRPLLVIDDVSVPNDAVRLIVAFLNRTRPRVLNVCGHRGDQSARLPGFKQIVRDIMKIAFQEMNQNH